MSDTKEVKISRLAQQLKNMHLAGSLEEATIRAREIIENSDTNDNTPIGELMKKELKKLKQEERADDKEVNELKREIESVKAMAAEETQEHVLEKEHFRKVKKKSDKVKEDVEDMGDVAEIAGEVQEEQ